MTPEEKNDANAERWWQSGVGVFGSGGLLVEIGVLFNQIGTHGLDFQSYDAAATWTALLAVAGFAGVLYRRYMPGLKPMFHSWFGS